MSRMRVSILAVVVGVAMVMPAPLVGWAGQQAQKIAKQEKNSEKKARQNKSEKKQEKERGKKEKNTGNDLKQEKEGKREDKKEQGEKKSEKTGEKKVMLCHKSSDKSEKARSITVGAAAVDAHLAHGDTKGPCK